MQCIGDLITGDSKNLDLLASKVLGEEPQVEPALNSILRIILRTSSMQEFIAADYVFKSFCEGVNGACCFMTASLEQTKGIEETTEAHKKQGNKISFLGILKFTVMVKLKLVDSVLVFITCIH